MEREREREREKFGSVDGNRQCHNFGFASLARKCSLVLLAVVLPPFRNKPVFQ